MIFISLKREVVIIRHVSSLLFSFNAALSFLIVFGFSIFLKIDDFALFAFSVAIGGFFSIIVNCGQDQTQIVGLIRRSTFKARIRFFCSRQFRSLIILLILCSLYYWFEGLLGHSLQNRIIATLAVIWSALIGIFPNSYIDHQGRIISQQILISFERMLALFLILFLFHCYSQVDLRLIVFVLLILRVLVILLQHIVCVLSDLRSKSDLKNTEISSLGERNDSGKVAFAQLITSAGLYGALFAFRQQASSIDIALVTFGIQCISFALLVPSAYIRNNLRELATSDVENSVGQNNLIISQAKELMKITIVSAFLVTSIIWFWLLLVIRSEVVITHLFSGAIFGIWAMAMAYGIRLSRAIIHRRLTSFYVRWALIYSGMSFVFSSILGVRFGVLGFVLGIVIPHCLVIFRYYCLFLNKSEFVR